MSFPLDTIKKKDHINFSQHSDALVKWLRKYWDISAEPKDYKEFVKDYKDFDGMDKDDVEKMLKEFKGHSDGGVCSHCFPVRVSTSQVAYDDKCQGRKPFETMIGAVLGYGMLLGERMAEVDEYSEANFRLSMAAHVFFQSQPRAFLSDEHTDKAIQKTYQMEVMEFLDKKNSYVPYDVITGKWEKARNAIEKKRFKKALRKALTKERTLTLYSSKNEEKQYLWGFLWQISRSSQKRYQELLQELGKLGVTIEMDKETFIVKGK